MGGDGRSKCSSADESDHAACSVAGSALTRLASRRSLAGATSKTSSPSQNMKADTATLVAGLKLNSSGVEVKCQPAEEAPRPSPETTAFWEGGSHVPCSLQLGYFWVPPKAWGQHVNASSAGRSFCNNRRGL